MDEQDWKRRFVEALAAKFISKGLERSAALADAEAHANEQFPRRGSGTVGEEAEIVYRSLEEPD
jgi:hypothetical protein